MKRNKLNEREFELLEFMISSFQELSYHLESISPYATKEEFEEFIFGFDNKAENFKEFLKKLKTIEGASYALSEDSKEVYDMLQPFKAMKKVKIKN